MFRFECYSIQVSKTTIFFVMLNSAFLIFSVLFCELSGYCTLVCSMSYSRNYIKVVLCAVMESERQKPIEITDPS